MTPLLRFSAACATLSVACSSADVPLPYIPPTNLYVNPASVTGELTCGSGEGSVRSYVATLFDRTPSAPVDPTLEPKNPAIPQCTSVDPDAAFQLPSSPPTSCGLRASFGGVVAGNSYEARVDVYDQPPCSGERKSGCLTPLGGLNSGSRIMLDSSGVAVAPLATACCGTPSTIPVLQAAVQMEGCVPLTSQAVSGAVVVRTQALLGGLSCGGTGPATDTTVAVVEATASGSATKVTTSCGDLQFAGLAPGKPVSISVFASAAGAGAPSWGAVCTAVPVRGSTISASCPALSSKGALRVDSQAVLSASKFVCPPGATVSLDAVGGGGSAKGPCGSVLQLEGLSAGVVTGILRVRDAASAPVFSAACTAAVPPGHSADGLCVGQ